MTPAIRAPNTTLIFSRLAVAVSEKQTSIAYPTSGAVLVLIGIVRPNQISSGCPRNSESATKNRVVVCIVPRRMPLVATQTSLERNRDELGGELPRQATACNARGNAHRHIGHPCSCVS